MSVRLNLHSLGVIASFLNPTDSGSLSGVNKECQKAADAALKSQSKTIRSSAPNTYLARMALMHPVARVNGKEMPLVRAVIADLKANQHLLQPEDWAALGIQGPPSAPLTRPFLNLSINELNLAGEVIEQRKKETSLVTAFTKILEQIPDQHPPLEGTLSQKVQTIRNWMAANQLLLDGILILDLSSLGLSAFPEELMRLNNLRALYLEGNQITHLPENFNPPNLRTLFLQNTPITHLPENFNPPNLRELYLTFSGITHLPENFNPPNLEKLRLAFSGITHLLANFNPPNLEELDLSYTPITHLPENFNPPNLEELDLSYTPITHLPENFNPPNLEKLDLSRNSITQLPENFNPPNLRNLNVSNAGITHLPPNLTLQNMSWKNWGILQFQLNVNRVRSIGETLLGLTALYLSS
jgi:Leucine-rich repeat (LRR) protein